MATISKCKTVDGASILNLSMSGWNRSRDAKQGSWLDDPTDFTHTSSDKYFAKYCKCNHREL